MQEQIVLPTLEKQEIADELHTKFTWSCGCITTLSDKFLTVIPCSSDCVVIERAKEVAEYYKASLVVKKKYEKPLFEKQTEMTFPLDILESFNKNSKFCLQCSGCHGCR